jgi:hypothetical protein
LKFVEKTTPIAVHTSGKGPSAVRASYQMKKALMKISPKTLLVLSNEKIC